MSGKTSRNKGNRGKLEATKLWIAAGYKDAKHSGTLQQGVGGTQFPDIFDVGRWWVECKYYAEITTGDVIRWWTKLVSECPDTHDPLLMFRLISKSEKNNPWLVVTLDHERPIHWTAFVEELKRVKKNKTVAGKVRSGG